MHYKEAELYGSYGLTRKNMAELACTNLLAGLNGARLPHCANPEVYE